MWLICGLGNPGKKYEFTRHNIGYEIVDSLIKFYQFDLFKKDKDKILYRGKIDSKECYFCKPLSYMNLSGLPIGKVSKYFKIPKSKIIIIHDDLDLNIGKIKIKTGGGNGGHNGLLSIDKIIGKSYKRIRVGIGHPGSKELVSGYVLKKFLNEEKKLINKKIKILTENFKLVFDDHNLLVTKIAL
tara:strand:- start:146 stop:700 length:555 start_codon:yes stop_codon:yes gene_type:complete